MTEVAVGGIKILAFRKLSLPRARTRRRKGKSVIYSITDDHVLMLVENTVALAAEKECVQASKERQS